MRYIKKILAKIITGTELPQEAENNAKLVQQVRATPGLIHDHVIKSQCSQGRSEVHYVSSDNRVMTRPTVLFVHGSPGSWESFAPYFLQPSFSEAFRLISIDRPGWGLSTFSGKAFPSELAEQARVLGPSIEAIYQQNKQQKIILVGHSLGGSLVPVLAATYPDYVRSVVILAGDVNPVLAQHRWYNSLLACVPRIFVAKHWYHSNLEILDLAKSLANQQEMMAQVQQPISIMQGTNDRLTDPKNVHFASSLFQQSALTIQWVPDKGHMINLMCVDLVKAAIMRSHESSEADSVP